MFSGFQRRISELLAIDQLKRIFNLEETGRVVCLSLFFIVQRLRIPEGRESLRECEHYFCFEFVHVNGISNPFMPNAVQLC